MKKFSLLLIALVSVWFVNAQSDTTIMYNDNKIVITEDGGEVSVYVEKIVPDSTVVDSIPPYIVDEYLEDPFPDDTITDSEDDNFFGNKYFTPDFKERVQRNFKRRHYKAHVTGIYLGFSNLATQNLQIGNVTNAVLKLNSYEMGWTMFSKDFRLSKRSRNYGVILSAGLGFRYHEYYADNNTHFKPINNYLTQLPAPVGVKYTESYLSVWYMNVPVVLEWQKKRGESSFFIQVGAEAGVKLSGRSKFIYSPEEDVVISQNIDKIDINPLTLDAKFQIGFNDVSLYVRYGLIDFFRTNRGATVIPVSAGINLHF